MEDPAKPPILHRSACAECQRRKQKCNREWPCNHCQKRKVADKCRFASASTTSPPERPPQQQQQQEQQQSAGTKRSLSGEDDDRGESDNEESDSDEGPGLEALGYMAGPLLSSLGVDINKTQKTVETEDFVTPESSVPLRQALKILPLRPKMDALVQLFFDNVNFHYYIIYPDTFLEEYQNWWERRAQNKKVSLQWTSLLIMVCACAVQHLDVEEKPQIELGFGEPSEVLTERFMQVGRELANSIPDGHFHLLNVQRMLHAIYWYKAEARFVEAWHLIGAAVRESQELGLPKQAASDGLPEFEREMRRRVWCILSTWDWQFASGLCRPTIIDHRDVDLAQPTLKLEGYHPSPLLHMKLQAEAVAILAARFGAPRNVQTPREINEYLRILETWMRTFPTVYSTEKPDLSKDVSHPWAVSHRFYIHTMAYLMVLNPIRTFMAKSYSKTSDPAELHIRDVGVNYSLRNLETTSQWTEHVHHRDGRFHFIIFSLFDTASVLCAAVLKDEDRTLPRRDEIVLGIERAVVLLRRLNAISKTAKTSYEILSRIAKRLPKANKYGNRKRAKLSSSLSLPSHPVAVAPGIEHKSEELGTTCGSDTTSPSNLNSYESATTGSTPRSQHVATPEELPNAEPDVLEQPISSFVSDDGSPYGDFDHTSVGLDSMLQPSYAPMREVHPELGFGGVNTSMGPYADLQPVAPGAVESFSFEPITDTELGEFSRLWDWGSLGLDFISSETAILPVAPQ